MTLPPKLANLGLLQEERDILYDHLRNNTPIPGLVSILREHGFDIGATTLKEARKALREEA